MIEKKEMTVTSSDLIRGELSSGYMSLSTQELVLQFLSTLWWSPEKLANARFNLEEIEEACKGFVPLALESLRGFSDTPLEGNMSHMQTIVCTMEELKKEMRPRAKFEKPHLCMKLTAVTASMVEIPLLWGLFMNHIEAATHSISFADDLTDLDLTATEPSTSSATLSAHQQTVFKFCNQLGILFFAKKKPVSGFNLRTFPLIAGPSGSGKSHLVRALAQAHSCEYFPVTFGTWMPQGSKAEQSTTEAIARCAARGRVLVHIDELDKMQSGFTTGWEISVLNDIWDLLQRTMNLRNMNFTEDADSKRKKLEETIRENIWVIGSGTWQEAFEGNRSSVGFGEELDNAGFADSALERIERLQLVPTELLARFNSRIQILTHPSAEEIAVFLSESEAAIELDVEQISEMEKAIRKYGFRAVENWITDYSIQEIANDNARDAPTYICGAAPIQSVMRGCIHAYEVEYQKDAFGNGNSHFVQIEEIRGSDIELRWVQRRTGKNQQGCAFGYEPLAYMDAWDSFARQWHTPQRQTVSMKTFVSWNPQRVQLPKLEPLNDQHEKLFELWKEKVLCEDSIEEDSRGLIETIYSDVYSEAQRYEIGENRFRIATAVLCSPFCRAFGEPDYEGPTITEIVKQCNSNVNQGVTEFYHCLCDRMGMADLQECLYAWENNLIDQVIGELETSVPICEQLAVPPSLRKFFDSHQITCDWNRLSDLQRHHFIEALDACKSLKKA